MQFFEYPKYVIDKVVNSKEEESEYLRQKGIVENDKENQEGIPGEIRKGQEFEQVESIQETGEGTACGSGDVQAHEQKQESPVGLLKRKPGRPKKV